MHDTDPMNRLAFEFFQIAARFEYALKAAGFHYGSGKEAKVNWESFGSTPELATLVNHPPTTALQEAIDYIITTPPKVQMVLADGSVKFEAKDTGQSDKAQTLLVLVRRIRNNLFHGAKFNEQWDDPLRSEALMKHGLVFMRAAIEAEPKVHKAFG